MRKKKLSIFVSYALIGVICLLVTLLLVWQSKSDEKIKDFQHSVVWDAGTSAVLSEDKSAKSGSTQSAPESLPANNLDNLDKAQSDHNKKKVTSTSDTVAKGDSKIISKKESMIGEEGVTPRKTPLVVTIRDENIKPDPLSSLEKDLEPRVAHRPIPLQIPEGKQIRLNVKFMDGVMARSVGDNQMEVSGLTQDDLNPFMKLSHAHDLVYSPAFDRQEDVDGLRIIAAKRSGEMQADLNGTMLVDIPSNKDSLKIAQTLQSLSFVESVDIESLDSPPPPPVDIAPTTPDLESLQGYLGTNPGFGVDDLKALGADGSGVRFSDCEYGYNPDHEDLEDGDLTNGSGAPIHSSVYSRGWDDHGTAAIGITMSQDNEYGVTGIAPGCRGAFYSEWTTSGYSRSNAVSNAVLDSAAGDVILLEMQTSGNGSGAYVPAEYASTIWNLCKTATDAGIIVVAAAGNANQDLDSAFYEPYMDRGNSGAIIVGAGSNSTEHSKLNFSTYGSRVDIHAWGARVMTTGYGDYASYGEDENQSYTSRFGGTSSASACIAGTVVLMQSHAKKNLKTIFTPKEMIALLRANGHSQTGSGGAIGPAIALDLAADKLPGGTPQLTVSSPNSDDISLSCVNLLSFRTYKIEESENLSQWNDLILDISSSTGEVDRMLTNEAQSYPKRFYRLRQEDAGNEE